MITGSSVLIIKKFIEENGLGPGIQFDAQKTLVNDYSALFDNEYYKLEVVLSSYHITFKLYTMHDGILSLESEMIFNECSEFDFITTLNTFYDSIPDVETNLTGLRLLSEGISLDPPFGPTMTEIVLSPDFASDEYLYTATVEPGDYKLEFDKEDWRASAEVKIKTGDVETEVSDIDKITLTEGTHLLKINLGDPIKGSSSKSYNITLTVATA